MAVEIGTEWIQIAMENGGHVDITRNHSDLCGYTIMARMRWANRAVIMGADCKTVAEALNSLDTELANDAVSEMAECGSI